MTITQAIAELLKRDKSVAIPHFGTLTSTPVPAKINLVTNDFTPPCSKIGFIADNTLQDDKLATYLSKKNNISQEEAERLIGDFVGDCKTEFQNHNKIDFEDLGRLSKKYDGDYEFELNDGINLNDDAFGLPEFHQNPILRNVVKDKDTDNDDDNDTDNDNDQNADNDQKEVVSVEGGQATLLQQDQQPEDEGKKDEDESNNVEKTETPQDDTDNKTNEEKESNGTESVKPEPEEKKRRKWPWILLLLLIILCAGFVALTYFELIPNYIPEIIKPKPTANYVIGGEPRPQYHYEYTEPEDTTTYLLPYPEAQNRFNDSIQHIADSLALVADSIATDTVATIEVVPPTDTVKATDTTTVKKTENEPVVPKPVVEPAKPEPKHLIVCGCFSMEENAQKKVNSLHELGFTNAFYKKRGSMWNVYYDSYVDKEDAKAALDEIRTTVNPKAWLLSTK